MSLSTIANYNFNPIVLFRYVAFLFLFSGLNALECTEIGEECLINKNKVDNDLFLTSCSKATPHQSNCKIGNLLITQKWKKNPKVKAGGYVVSDKFHFVVVTNMINGKSASISCENIVVNENMSCQISPEIGDPGWSDETPLFPIKEYKYNTISNSFIGFTIRSSANGGYFGSQYLFNTNGSKSVLIPWIYGRWTNVSIIEDSGYLFINEEIDNSFRMATCCSIIDLILKRRTYKIDPYDLSVLKLKEDVKLPPRSIISKKILIVKNEPDEKKVMNLFQELWRYYILSSGAEETKWVQRKMIEFRDLKSFNKYQVFKNHKNIKVITRMIRNTNNTLNRK